MSFGSLTSLLVYDDARIVSEQVAAALDGSYLDQLEQAPGRDKFEGAATLERAYLVAAYWTAVAARLDKVKSWGLDPTTKLAGSATWLAEKAAVAAVVPGKTEDPTQIASVFRGAAETIEPYSVDHYQIKWIADWLRQWADPSNILEKQKTEASRKLWCRLYWLGGAAAVVGGLLYARGRRRK